LRHFRLLAFPEQIRETVVAGVTPVVPLWFSRDDLNRIIPWLVRKKIPFACAHSRTLVSYERLGEALKWTSGFFCFTPEVVEMARAARYDGEIFLFSNVAMLSWPAWYRDNAVRPVVSSRRGWMVAQGLSPLFFVTTKRCIAEWGTCRSRCGEIQTVVACDHRCRDKARGRRTVDAPLSLQPYHRFPAGSDALLSYNEETLTPLNPEEGDLPPDELSEEWNYRLSIGHRIITEARRRESCLFSIDLREEERVLFNEGLIGFWAYERSLYDGRWTTPREVLTTKRHLLLTFSEPIRKLLVIQRDTPESYAAFKRARHHIYTMPSESFFMTPDKSEREGAEFTAGVMPRRMFLVLDSLERRNFFKSRHVAQVSVLYTGGPLNRFFEYYLYLPFAVSEEDVRAIVAHRWLKGVVVQDRLLRRMFEAAFRGTKKVFLHPALLDPEEPGPSCLVACEQVFRSPHRVAEKASHGWKSLRVRPYPLPNGTMFLRDTPWFRPGDTDELWVDIIGATDERVRTIKGRAECFLKRRGRTENDMKM